MKRETKDRAISTAKLMSAAAVAPAVVKYGNRARKLKYLKGFGKSLQSMHNVKGGKLTPSVKTMRRLGKGKQFVGNVARGASKAVASDFIAGMAVARMFP